MLIGAHDYFLSSQRAYQHEERGLWQMEVGQKRANDAKTISGINEDICLAAARLKPAPSSCILQSSDSRGPNGNHASPRA